MKVELNKLARVFNSFIDTDAYEETFKKLNVEEADIDSFAELTCSLAGIMFLEDENNPSHSASDGDGNFDWFKIPEKFVEPLKEYYHSEVERLTNELAAKGYELIF
jgi:hypothetical protein